VKIRKCSYFSGKRSFVDPESYEMFLGVTSHIRFVSAFDMLCQLYFQLVLEKVSEKAGLKKRKKMAGKSTFCQSRPNSSKPSKNSFSSSSVQRPIVALPVIKYAGYLHFLLPSFLSFLVSSLLREVYALFLFLWLRSDLLMIIVIVNTIWIKLPRRLAF
jgi:hypothetical protein